MKMKKNPQENPQIPATKVPGDMLQLAEHILKQKKGHFKPEKFEDRYEDALSALGGRERKRGRQRALARAAFPGEHDQPPIEQPGARLWSRLLHGSAGL